MFLKNKISPGTKFLSNHSTIILHPFKAKQTRFLLYLYAHLFFTLSDFILTAS